VPLVAPNLDDRTFADIVAEVKTLIPRYTPEWTDLNESDPGITLIELFAWMTDMLLFRLNQVPERNYIKFLQLLGIELEAAQPARAELTFTLSRPDIKTAIVPLETQVAVSGGSDKPIVFETDEALVALGAVLKAVMSFDGFSYSLETTKNATPGQWFYPFGANAHEGSALMLGFDSPVSFPADQVNIAINVYTQATQVQSYQCGPLASIPLPATLVWEYWDGLEWQPISLDKDETRAFSRSGHVYFPGPGDFLKKRQFPLVTDNLYWIRVRLETSTYERAPRLSAILTNTVRATQAITVRDEIVGGSDGRPSQTFQLANFPVVVRDKPDSVPNPPAPPVMITSLRLEIDEGQGFAVWQQVDDFYASGPNDPHYLLDLTTGAIQFGNGDHGRIPLANPAAPNSNIVAREYRFGGGSQGNVGAGTITELQTFVDGVDTVTNLQPSSGGSDEESVADAKLRAPLALKSKGRAVTAEDFEYLALVTPGVLVRRANALPLYHPKFPDGQTPGVVTVIVVPDSDAPNPTPNETTLTAVCAWLDRHRLLTCEVYVVGPIYRKIKIQAAIVVQGNADLAEVKNAVQTALTSFFHPLTGGDSGTGWPFGGEIYFSQVYRQILIVPGVSRIQQNGLVIWLDDLRQLDCRDVPIGAAELLYTDPKGHDIRASYSATQ
jgi:hypothetical protein